MGKYFGTDGFRGEANCNLTADHAFKVGRFLPEADSTALMLDHMLQGVNVKRTRLARGIPMGSDLEFVDEVTMLRAFEGRVSL